LRFSPITRDGPPPDARMRLSTRACLLATLLLLGACAILHRPTPPPPPESAPPPPVAAPPPLEPAPVKKPKPHPKPAPAPARATVDGLAPDEVGYYLDVMHGRLKQLAGSSVGMERRGERIVILATAQFDASTGKLELDAAHSRPFAGIAKVLMEYRKTRVSVQASNVDGKAAPDTATRAACEQALLHYLEGAGVAAEQLSGMTNARGDSASGAKSAYFAITIDPVLRDVSVAQ
jgi:hypothetical protein